MPITSFSGDYAFLSNFYQARIVIEDHSYPDVEHYFQCMKTTEPEEFGWVLAAPTAAEAKKRGRGITCRDDWEAWKRQYMLNGVLAKFAQYDSLREALALTGGELLVEGNYRHDNYWGSCYCRRPSCDGAKSMNYLGKILMAVRMVLC